MKKHYFLTHPRIFLKILKSKTNFYFCIAKLIHFSFVFLSPLSFLTSFSLPTPLSIFLVLSLPLLFQSFCPSLSLSVSILSPSLLLFFSSALLTNIFYLFVFLFDSTRTYMFFLHLFHRVVTISPFRLQKFFEKWLQKFPPNIIYWLPFWFAYSLPGQMPVSWFFVIL